jgi:hypothetical protein
MNDKTIPIHAFMPEDDRENWNLLEQPEQVHGGLVLN